MIVGKLVWVLVDFGKVGVFGVVVFGVLVVVLLVKEILEVLVDLCSWWCYVWGCFLGKGGFVKCFEILDVDIKEVFVGKIVFKFLLFKLY